MSRWQRIVAWGLFTLTLMLLSGWLLADHLTPGVVGPPSHTLPVQPDETALDREIAPLVAKHDGQTGAILLPNGIDAFAARALSAREAGRSLDLQYYIWHNDLTGRLLAREAYLAAERGVRVRVLVDDMNGQGNDTGLMALDAHPNIEIRVYNPFRNRGGIFRVIELVQRFYSANHRMHNKAWIADGRAAVVGGRNIGEEYFDASTESNFRDLDMLLFGPAVKQVSAIFDDYWNSEAVVPLNALADDQPDDAQALIQRVHEEAASPAARRYFERMEHSGNVREYMSKALTPHWTHRIEVVSDPPLKWKDDDRGNWLVDRLMHTLQGTRRKALLVSPYFVPGDDATDGLVSLVRDRGAFVGVVTNSLAANDVPAVHAGYSGYRGRLLDGGVHLYELRARAADGGRGEDTRKRAADARPADASDRPSERQESGGNAGLFGSSGASLHTKAFVVDDSRGFVGSFNLDPRSATLNTEMGVLFDDPALARAVRDEYMKLASPALSYWVYRDADGDLRWLDRATTPPTVRTQEPDSSLWQRIVARVLRWLPIESQL